jgi:hypothetical protein
LTGLGDIVHVDAEGHELLHVAALRPAVAISSVLVIELPFPSNGDYFGL